MTCVVNRQLAAHSTAIPEAGQLQSWVTAALGAASEPCELTVRFVDNEEGARLNTHYRQGRGATNVLSFPAEQPAFGGPRYLGDLVLTVPLIEAQARARQKSPEAHFAHLVVHGVLHLLGHDHQHDGEAARMESLEREILAQLGYSDPYSA